MGRERLSVNQAANQLGITPDAVRSRIKRGSLQAERENGTVVVLLDSQPAADQPHDQSLVQALQARVESLEKALDAEREANRENRRIIMQQAQSLAAIEPPESGTERPESAPDTPPGDTPSGAQPQPTRGPLERLSRWWRGG